MEFESLSGIEGIPVLEEKRAVIVVWCEKCHAFERMVAVGVGVHVPVRTVPFAWAVEVLVSGRFGEGLSW